MLEAISTGFLSWGFTVYRGDEKVAELDMFTFRERASAWIGNRNYMFARESILQGTYALKDGDQVLARAQEYGWLRPSFDVEVAEGQATLRSASFWRRDFELRKGAAPIGCIYSTGWFRRKIVIDLPDGLSIPEQIFLFWLVQVIWRRADSSG
jgi:hypothetical protein